MISVIERLYLYLGLGNRPSIISRYLYLNYLILCLNYLIYFTYRLSLARVPIYIRFFIDLMFIDSYKL